MRERFGSFPASYKLDATCVNIVNRMQAHRATASAAIRAVSGYALGKEHMERIIAELGVSVEPTS